MKLAKALLGFGAFAIIGAVVILVIYAVKEEASWVTWAMALGLAGVAAVTAGLVGTLRWQNQRLNQLLARRSDSAVRSETITREDLSELVRVIDARVVGLIETLQDDSPARS